MAFFLWKKDESTDYLPVRLAEVRWSDGAIQVLGCSDPMIQTLAGELQARSSLRFKVERMTEHGALVLSQQEATPGDPAYEMALCQAFQREGGVRYSFSPEFE